MSGYKMTELGEIPEDWEVVRLIDVAEINSSNVDKKSVDGEIEVRLCNYMDVYRNNYINNGLEFMKATATKLQFDKFILKKGDLIITKDSETKEDIAQSTYVSENFDDVLCGYHLSLIRPKEKISNGLFLSKLFNIEEIRKQLVNKANGTTRYGLSIATVENLIIPLPPLPEQQKIASILSTVDEKIEIIEAQISQTQELKKGLMQQLLTKGIGHTKFKDSPLGEIPESWEVKELDEISNITRLAGYEYSEYWQEDINGEIMTLRGFNIGKNKILLREIVSISNELSLKLNRSRLYKGDVVFPCVGTIGNAAVIEEDDKFHINQNIAKITPYPILDSHFLVHYMISDLCKKEINRFNATTSQPNVLVGSLRKFRIPFPLNKKEQSKIANLLSTVDEKLDLLQEKKTNYQEMKKGLMQQLLTGKIRVN